MEYLKNNPLLRIGIIVLLAVSTLYLGLFAPLSKENTRLKRMITMYERDYQELQSLGQEFILSRGVLDELKSSVKRKGSGGSHATTLENLARQVGIKERITSMKPLSSTDIEEFSTEVIEVKVQDVTLDTLVKYLQAIENGPSNLLIKRVDMKRKADRTGNIDVVVHIVSINTL